jgi:hypothetical protein
VLVLGMVRGRVYRAYAQKASHTGGLDVSQLPVVAVPLEFPYEVPLVVPFTVLVQLDAPRATRYGMVGDHSVVRMPFNAGRFWMVERIMSRNIEEEDDDDDDEIKR